MKPRWFATLLIGAVLGTCLGVLILVVACKYDSDPLGKLIEIICAPAIWCAHYWTYVLDLPPHGEAGFVVVPMTAMVFQWTLLGILIGLIWWLLKLCWERSESSLSKGGRIDAPH
jgi:hypothetical protein